MTVIEIRPHRWAGKLLKLLTTRIESCDGVIETHERAGEFKEC